jgi:hypothetical protein
LVLSDRFFFITLSSSRPPDIVGIRSRLPGAGDWGAARGASFFINGLGVPAGPLARDFLSAPSLRISDVMESIKVGSTRRINNGEGV